MAWSTACPTGTPQIDIVDHELLAVEPPWDNREQTIEVRFPLGIPPAERFLKQCLDLLRVSECQNQQKQGHDLSVPACLLIEGDKVWVRNFSKGHFT